MAQIFLKMAKIRFSWLEASRSSNCSFFSFFLPKLLLLVAYPHRLCGWSVTGNFLEIWTLNCSKFWRLGWSLTMGRHLSALSCCHKPFEVLSNDSRCHGLLLTHKPVACCFWDYLSQVWYIAEASLLVIETLHWKLCWGKTCIEQQCFVLPSASIADLVSILWGSYPLLHYQRRSHTLWGMLKCGFYF